MATLLEVSEAMAWLSTAYPRHKFDTATIRTYHEILGDLDYGLVKAAAQHIASQPGAWFPSAGDWRKAAFDLIEHEAGVPSSGEAWAEALATINYYKVLGPGDFSSPLVFEALQAIGGNRVLCTTPEDMLTAARARYCDAYATLLQRERTGLQMLPAVREVARRLSIATVLALPDNGSG